MKTKILLLLLATVSLAFASEKVAAGPKGGRLLATAPHAAEFLVTADRHVEITFYDDALQPVAPGAQTVAITAEPAGGKVQLELARTSTGYLSKTALPASDDAYRIVVQVRAGPGTKPQNFRIDLNLDLCGECKHAEYACTCEGH